jgi:hypothetical protein
MIRQVFKQKGWGYSMSELVISTPSTEKRGGRRQKVKFSERKGFQD